MVKLERAQVRVIGDAFITYLKDNNLLKTIAKPNLKQIYEDNFREEVKCVQRSSFSTVLYNLSRYPPRKVVVKSGYITFKDTADWSNSKTSNRIEGTLQLQSERFNIYKVIRAKAKRDFFLNSPYINLTIEPAELESNPGYVNCDLEIQTKFTIQIRNTSNADVFLKKCLFLRNNSYLLLQDEHNITSSDHLRTIKMEPGSVYSVTVSCDIDDDQVGSYTDDLFFRFNVEEYVDDFYLLRYVRFFKSDEIIELLKPTAPYKQGKKCELDESLYTMSGIKLEYSSSLNRLAYTRPLKDNRVPGYVKAAFERGVFRNPKDNYHVELKEIDKQMIELLENDLKLDNYTARFSLLIYIEEMQTQIDICSYDLKAVTVERGDYSRFILKVPGLAERRPSILKGDRLYLRRINNLGPESLRFEGFVHLVGKDHVELRFHKDFDLTFQRTMKFDVRFTVSRHPIKLQQRAISSVPSGPNKKILFPEHISENPLPDERLVVYNRKIQDNPRQLEAVAAILHGTSKSPYIIYGPPGTGKTMTVVEAIEQVVLQQNKRVLVCAPSNSACDLVIERIVSGGRFQGHIPRDDIFRMHAMSRQWNEVPVDVRPVSNYRAKKGGYFYPAKEEILNYKVVATTLVTAGRLSSAEVDTFDFIFIDEAGHAVEPECLIAVDHLLSEDGRLVLAGDPKQLGPILRSHAAHEYGLETSLIERLMEYIDIYQSDEIGCYNPKVITKLLKNYRSHEAILKIPNECFYEGELEVCADEVLVEQFCDWEHLRKEGFPIIFHGVRGSDQREESSPSFFNSEEAVIVNDYVIKILNRRRNRVQACDIGIISPYRKQVQKLRQMLSKTGGKRNVFVEPKPDLKTIKIGSVEEFQGQERRVIIISTVRSNTEHLGMDEKFNLGFLKNCKRFNVAVTRAISLLIVVGNPEILSRDYYWNELINHCYKNKSYVGLPYKPAPAPTTDDEKVNDVTDQMKSLALDDYISSLQSHIEPPHVDKI